MKVFGRSPGQILKEELHSQLQHLVTIGKEKGFLTCDEVNDILPSDIFAPKQIDETLSLLGEMHIEPSLLCLCCAGDIN